MSTVLGKADHFVPGDHNAICDVCGFKFKASQLRKRWDGYMVCSTDFEERHPQDLIRIRGEKTSIPFARPEQPFNYVTPAPANWDDL